MGVQPAIHELKARLTQIVGAGNLLDDPAELNFYSTDVYSAGATAVLVITPTTVDSVSAAVAAITDAGCGVVARGGGMSYTGGYVPSREGTVIVDLSGLNRIVEINADDMYLTVEAGVTWQQIHDALRPKSLRLPFFGTFSGSRATVGGGMSNGALFMATARYGTAAEIVLGLEVVTAGGEVIKTGQGALRNGKPFYRTYGPDLTGLFVHDAGALGIKTRISLRMIQAPAHTGFASFVFADRDQAALALSAIARADLTEEAYIFDPATTRNSLSMGDLRQNLRKLIGVAKGQSSFAKGLRESAKLIAAGKDFIDDDLYSLHLVCAGRCEAAVEADLNACREIAENLDGAEVANSIPKAARADPFGPLNGILGANGERWAALNAKVAHSDAVPTIDAVEQALAPYRPRMQQHGVSMSWLFIAISNHAFSVEPVFRWADQWLPVHRRTPEPAHLARLTEPEPNPAASQLVDELRGKVVALFAELGAASNQIGKTYPWYQSLEPNTAALVGALKKELDPLGLVNPGALGLPMK